MANRLQKLAAIQYTPGTPGRAAQPAFCVSTPVYHPGGTVVLTYRVVKDSSGATYYIPVYEQREARTEYVTTCYPAIPAIPAIPAVTQYLPINGWNGGANSRAMLAKDGHFEFRVSGNPRGVVIGLANQNVSTLPSEQSHAFYFHGSQVDLMEYGRVIASAVLDHDSSRLYRIARRGEQVTFEADGWSHVSTLPSIGAVVLDAALYTSGDYVQDPAMLAYANGGSASGSLAALSGLASDASGYQFAAGSLPALSGEAIGYTPVTLVGSLPALSGIASEGAYAEAAGSLPALSGEAVGGYPTFNIVSLQGSLAPLNGSAHGLTGEIGYIEGGLPALSGYIADRPYAAGDGSFAPLTGRAYQGQSLTRGHISSPLALGGSFRSSTPERDGIRSVLQVGGRFDLFITARDGIASALLVGARFGGTFDAFDGISGGLLLGGRFADSAQADSLLGLLDAQPLQLATNLANGAPTLYLDCAFTSYTRVGDQLYAVRADGLYLLGAGDDEGQGLRGLVDFGASDFGSSQIKRADSVYLGLKTDAALELQTESDSGAHAYPVDFGGTMARAKLGRGSYGRTWNLALEFSDASYFELDTLEVQVGASQRRVRGRQA